MDFRPGLDNFSTPPGLLLNVSSLSLLCWGKLGLPPFFLMVGCRIPDAQQNPGFLRCLVRHAGSYAESQFYPVFAEGGISDTCPLPLRFQVRRKFKRAGWAHDRLDGRFQNGTANFISGK